MVAAYDVTANVQSLNINQTTTGSVATPYSTDQWTFSAAASTQVQFDLLAESASGLNFSLTGPNGFSGFTGITGSSSLVTLPTSGTYTLIGPGDGRGHGQLLVRGGADRQTPLALGDALQRNVRRERRAAIVRRQRAVGGADDPPA